MSLNQHIAMIEQRAVASDTAIISNDENIDDVEQTIGTVALFYCTIPRKYTMMIFKRYDTDKPGDIDLQELELGLVPKASKA